MHGDLDNSISHRWMVTLDGLCDGKKMPAKRLLKSWDTVARETPIQVLNLGRLWRWAERAGVRFECVIFGQPHEYCEAIEAQLDRMGAHPIAWVSGYRDPEALQSTLSFRPDVQAVLDVRERALFWGRRGMAMGDLQ